jgi:hypothetical protein
MQLISQDELLNYKITSYERAIVFSAMLLGAGDLIDNYQAVSITELLDTQSLPIKALLLVKIAIPFKKEESYRSFGGFIKNILEINLNNPYPLLIANSDISGWNYDKYPLPSTPSWIDTFEEFFYWLITNYQEKLLTNKESTYNFISIKNNLNTSIDIEVNIPFDYQKYLIVQNYLESVYPIYLWGKPLTNDNINVIINNNNVINNNSIIGN